MTVPPGDWDKVYDSTLGTTPIGQGWLDFGQWPGAMTGGYWRAYYEDGNSAAAQEIATQVVTLAARFKVVTPIEPPGSNDLGTCALLMGYDNYIVYLIFSKDGLKTSYDLISITPPVYDLVDFEDGEFHEVYGVFNFGDDALNVYIDGLLAWTEDLALYEFAFSLGTFSYSPAGNYMEAGVQSVSDVDWIVASYDEMILPELFEPGVFGDTTVSLGAAGIVVAFDELALYDAPLSETAIQRHWQSSQGIPSL